MNDKKMVRIGVVGLMVASGLVAGRSLALPLEDRPTEKITFDLSTISSEGLATQTGGGAISYEFCIPATEAHVAAVEAIDPSVTAFPHSKGRIGCRNDQYLCIGNTHQADWREKLMALARLDYIEQIDRFWGE